MRLKESSIRWSANPTIGILEGVLFVGRGLYFGMPRFFPGWIFSTSAAT